MPKFANISRFPSLYLTRNNRLSYSASIGAVATLIAALSSSVVAQEISSSSGWIISPIALIPMESSILSHSLNYTGQHVQDNASAITASVIFTNSSTSSPVSPNILAGFAAGYGESVSWSGGNTYAAFSSGFGVGLSGQIFSTAPLTVSGNGAATLAAQSQSITIPNSSASANISADYQVTGISSAQATLTIAANTQASSAGSLVPTDNNLDLTTATNGNLVYAPSNLGSFSATMANMPVLSFSHGATGNLNTQFTTAIDGLNISSAYSGASAIQFLANSTNGNLVHLSDFSGDNQSINTSSDNSLGIHGAFLGQRATVITNVSGSNFNVATQGNSSSGIATTIDGQNSASLTMAINSMNSSIRTLGDQATAIFNTANSGAGDSELSFLYGSGQSLISTSGQNSSAIVLANTAAQNANSNVILSGEHSTLDTKGTGAAALVSIVQGASSSSNSISISGSDFTVHTAGDQSPSVVGLTQSNGSSNFEFSLSGANSKVATDGNQAPAILAMNQGGTGSSQAFTLSGTNSSVTTQQDNSAGLFAISSGQSAQNSLVLSGTNASVSTLGSASLGAILVSMGVLDGTSSAILSGQNANITTSGDLSSGVYLAATRTDANQPAAIAELTLSGGSSFISTTGTQAYGATLAGDYARLNLTGSGANIMTTGNGSHGAFLLAANSRVVLNTDTNITAAAAGSDGLHFAGVGNQASVHNQGTIFAQRHGINLDHGAVENFGHIRGDVAIYGRQANDLPIDIQNHGFIQAASGPSTMAINFLGQGNDRLYLTANAALSGLIELGAGQDVFQTGAGTSVDMIFESAPETIIAGSGFLTTNNGGREVVIVDPIIYLRSAPTLTKQVLASLEFGELSEHLTIQKRESNADECQLTSAISSSIYGSSQPQIGISSAYKAQGTNYVASIGNEGCSQHSVRVFGGYYTSSGSTTRATKMNAEGYVLGATGQFNWDDTLPVSVSAGVSWFTQDFTRRVINNREVAGFEIANADNEFGSAFVNLRISKHLDMENWAISPYGTVSYAVTQSGAINENGVRSALSLSSQNHHLLETTLGIKATGARHELRGNYWGNIEADIALKHSVEKASNYSVAFAGANFSPATTTKSDARIEAALYWNIFSQDSTKFLRTGVSVQSGLNGSNDHNIQGKITFGF